MKITLHTVLFCLLAMGLNAQTGSWLNRYNQVLEIKRYGEVVGTPYYFEGWHPGKIYTYDGKQLEHPRVNYNGLTGKFELQEKSDQIIEISNIQYAKVILDTPEGTMTFANRYGKTTVTNYYREIYKGEKLAFLEKFKSSIERKEEPEYGSATYKDKFIEKTQYYVWKDEKLNEIGRGGKKILSFINSSALNKYVKKQKLNLKRDADLKLALAYYETL